jgi:hypothetical protein
MAGFLPGAEAVAMVKQIPEWQGQTMAIFVHNVEDGHIDVTDPSRAVIGWRVAPKGRPKPNSTFR